ERFTVASTPSKDPRKKLDYTAISTFNDRTAENRRDVVELLLKRRAKPNLQTRQGVTALIASKKQLIDGIAHELRTPLVRLRYRLEMSENLTEAE
ncbi:YnfC family lipoprotein, partial [Klebsiella pneumoniae]